MTDKLQEKKDFHWTAPEFLLALVAGVMAVGVVWLFSGLLVGLFV